MLYRLEYKQKFQIDIQKLWRFISCPQNLKSITPTFLNFEILASDSFDKTYAGMLITYRVRPVLKWPITWVTEITHANPPHYFVDEQRFGPYKFWHHQHILTNTEKGVEMTDIIHYKLHGLFLAPIINSILVKPKLNFIFQHRKSKLIELFGSADL